MPPKRPTSSTIDLNEEFGRFYRNSKLIKNAIVNFEKLGVSQQTKPVVEGRLRLVESYWTICQQAAGRIDQWADEDDREQQDYFTKDLSDVVEAHYLEAYDYLQERLASFFKGSTSNKTATPSTDAAAELPFSIKLPPIAVPTFTGDATMWVSFRDMFTSLVGERDSISNVQKLYYLLSVVSGEAAKIIGGLPLTEANFKVAWGLLKEKYEDRKAILNAHFSIFFSIPSISSEILPGLKRLRATFSETLSSLKALNEPVEQWNDIVVFYLISKLDKQTRQAWEASLGPGNDYPTVDQFTKFVDTRIRVLQATQTGPISHGVKPSQTVSTRVHAHLTEARAPPSCSLCNASHQLMKCEKFVKMTLSERRNFVNKNNLCQNCLGKHSLNRCRSKFNCYTCHKRHHTLLHKGNGQGVKLASFQEQAAFGAGIEEAAQQTTMVNVPAPPLSSQPPTEFHAHMNFHPTLAVSTALLATAWVQADSGFGRRALVRALIDQGSDASFITESLAQTLRLPKDSICARVTGIGGEGGTTVSRGARFRIRPDGTTGPELQVRALIIPKITSYTPVRLDPAELAVFKNLGKLADPEPTSNSSIDLLIGADLYSSILLQGIYKHPGTSLLAQNSIFGWILSGALRAQAPIGRQIRVHHAHCKELLDSLHRFWEVEELPTQRYPTPDEVRCEEHFVSTFTRDSSGRFILRLPFQKEPPLEIGETRKMATAMLLRLERRFKINPGLKFQYTQYMSNMLSSGHMIEFQNSDASLQTVVLPHREVIKTESATTKLRVVLNASAPSSNGSSLNDFLLPGPKLQADLVSILMRWRNFQYAFTADIMQMYRQIWIHPEDQRFQLILWRFKPEDPITEYALTTVTFGTSSAPFQAQRVIEQIVQDEGHRFSLAATILKTDRYVDDVISGDDDVARAVEKRDQLVTCLATAGFQIRKWASNSPEILAGLDSSNHGIALEKPFAEDASLKVLGVHWCPVRDVFQFQICLPEWVTPTKRLITSLIARIYDPMGWLAPITITAKILIQTLWKIQADWDSSLPEVIISKWRSFYDQLPVLQNLEVRRWTGKTQGSSIQLHGFCDASEQAYAAIIYMVIENEGLKNVSIVLSKTKVAPLKLLTIPRLELLAASLLSQSMKYILNSLDFPVKEVVCWSDSSIVLGWISRHPSTLKTFVANRVAKIQEDTDIFKWRHVPTSENPADCASRGLEPSRLQNFSLWWQGPSWLEKDETEWPTQVHSQRSDDEDYEARHTQIVQAHLAQQQERSLADSVSSWPRLLRITAYVFRFIRRCRNRGSHSQPIWLSSKEIEVARCYWLKTAQKDLFSEELNLLSQGKVVNRSSSLARLDPYLDEEGLIRVGGRLNKADLPSDTKHPIVLAKHRISELLIEDIHFRTLHGGVQLVLRTLRECYWVLNARSLTRSHIFKCIPCTRANAKPLEQFMANLPAPRVNRSLPFEHTGVDFAGPILLCDRTGRGQKSHKAYVALFVCLATRAVHLELVHNYSTKAFLAALGVFFDLRGKVSVLYSDNGTNFRGADRELTAEFRRVSQDPIARNALALDRIEWQFIPPAAPHFGGLWESGVKSVKHHLSRIVQGDKILTVEEMRALLARIASCLNSRPIAPLKDDLESYDVLTPGHFLTLRAPGSLPRPSVFDLNEGRLSRWQAVQRKTEQFWRLWTRDYLQTLQTRMKWRTRNPNLKIHDLVLIQNNLLPPTKWEMGRVVAVHPDAEGIVRSVKLRTATSTYTRPIVKLCKLPIDQ